MKRLLLAILALSILAVMGLSGCSSEVKTYSDSSQVINAQVNQEFIISLVSNKTTGYSWQAVFDSSALEKVNYVYKEDNTGTPVVGAGGTELFTFKALKVGETKITFAYYRPFETPTANDQTQTFTIDVK